MVSGIRGEEAVRTNREVPPSAPATKRLVLTGGF